jgi:hypothetical protein
MTKGYTDVFMKERGGKALVASSSCYDVAPGKVEESLSHIT